MTKSDKKKAPAKPKSNDKKAGKVTQIDELELTKIVGGGFYDPANNIELF